MFHSEHHLQIHNLMHSSMSRIYVFQAIHTFVSSLIGIFVPLYLYSIGVELLMIFIFVSSLSFMRLVVTPICVQFLNKAGLKWTIFSSLPFYILYLNSLTSITNDFYSLIPSMILGSIYSSLYWPAMHAEVAQRSLGDSSKIGNLQIIITLMSSLAPFIGGFILEFSSYQLVLLASLSLLGIGAIPLLFSEEIPLKKIKYSYSKQFSYLKFKGFKKNIPFIGEGIESYLVLTIAPLLFFIWLKGNFASIGAILSIFSYISIVFVIFFKRYIKDKSKTKSVKMMAKVSSYQWIIRAIAYIIGGVFVFIIEGIYKMIQKAFYITYFSIFYEQGSKKFDKTFDIIMRRETVIAVTRLLFGIILYLISTVVEISYQLLIGLLLIGVFGSILKGFIADIES